MHRVAFLRVAVQFFHYTITEERITGRKKVLPAYLWDGHLLQGAFLQEEMHIYEILMAECQRPWQDPYK